MIAVGQPSFDEHEVAAVLRVMQSGRLTQGAEVAAFEQEFAKYIGSRHAIAVSSGTTALHLALLALDLQPGDEVIVPTTRFVATANAVAYTGATPIFVDVDPLTWCLSVTGVHRALTNRTRAIIPVHLYGAPADMMNLRQIAADADVRLVEDAAEALGATYRGQNVGTIGSLGIFSFYGNKTITTGEGGMVVTDNPWLDERVRLLRGQGQSPERRYWHTTIGYNYRMTELQAALGRTQLTKLPALLSTRQVAASLYRWKLERLVDFQQVPSGAVHGNWGFVVMFRNRADAEAVAQVLDARGIETRPVFPPIHTMSMYTDGRPRHPVACDLNDRGLVLPMHAELKPADIDLVCNTIVQVLRG